MRPNTQPSCAAVATCGMRAFQSTMPIFRVAGASLAVALLLRYAIALDAGLAARPGDAAAGGGVTGGAGPRVQPARMWRHARGLKTRKATSKSESPEDHAAPSGRGIVIWSSGSRGELLLSDAIHQRLAGSRLDSMYSLCGTRAGFSSDISKRRLRKCFKAFPRDGSYLANIQSPERDSHIPTPRPLFEQLSKADAKVLVVIRRSNWLRMSISSAERKLDGVPETAAPGSMARTQAMYDLFHPAAAGQPKPIGWVEKKRKQAADEVKTVLKAAKGLGYRVVTVDYDNESNWACHRADLVLQAVVKEGILPSMPSGPCVGSWFATAGGGLHQHESSLVERVGPQAASLIHDTMMLSEDRWMLDLDSESPAGSRMASATPAGAEFRSVRPRGIVVWSQGRSEASALLEALAERTSRDSLPLHPLCGHLAALSSGPPSTESLQRCLSGVPSQEPFLTHWRPGHPEQGSDQATPHELLRQARQQGAKVLVVIRKANWLARAVSHAEQAMAQAKSTREPGSAQRQQGMYNFFRSVSPRQTSPTWYKRLAAHVNHDLDTGMQAAVELGYRVLLLDHDESSWPCPQVQQVLSAAAEEGVLPRRVEGQCLAGGQQSGSGSGQGLSLDERVGTAAAHLIRRNMEPSPCSWMLDLSAERPLEVQAPARHLVAHQDMDLRR